MPTLLAPTSAEIVQHFGAESLIFQQASRLLHDLLSSFKQRSSLDRYQYWRTTLAQIQPLAAFAQQLEQENLFIRHIFLVWLAKITASIALKGPPKSETELIGIVSGTIFQPFYFKSQPSLDFFTWLILDDQARRGLKILDLLAQSLASYDFTQVEEDIFKQLYQNLIKPQDRQDLGEFYTPDWLAELILQEIDYHYPQKLLDPACGSGTFLFSAIQQLAKQGLTGSKLRDFALANIVGIDVNSLACTLACTNFILALTPYLSKVDFEISRKPLVIPVFCTDALFNSFLADKFTVIVGNPPWLNYRSLQQKTYQAAIKQLTLQYGLLQKKDIKLFAQLEIATLFWRHSEEIYLEEQGTLAFVLPRSVITGAKQHRNFQKCQFSKIIDLQKISPLFDVPTCVLIQQKERLQTNLISTICYSALFPTQQITLATAQKYLKSKQTMTNLFGKVKVAGRHYYDQFKAGATLIPRNLCFVHPLSSNGAKPLMQTDPDVRNSAKKPWKDIYLEGFVTENNLFATLLSKNLVPFGFLRLHLVALPICVKEGKLLAMEREDFLAKGHFDTWATWFQPANLHWNALKKETSQFKNLLSRYNYHQTLLKQQPLGVYKILYNSSGSHLAACVLNLQEKELTVYGQLTQGFISDSGNYYFETKHLTETHYLCAILNAPSLNEFIKVHQPRGTFGERHIQRIPFEVCAIPPFDENNPDHCALVYLSQEAHQIIANLTFSGGVVKARNQARAALTAHLQAIDLIVQRIFGFRQCLEGKEKRENNE